MNTNTQKASFSISMAKKITLLLLILWVSPPLMVAGQPISKDIERWEKGEEIFRTRGCSSCHIPPEGLDAGKFAPPLNGLIGKLKNKKWLPLWLLSPQKIRPVTMMPDFRMDASTAHDVSVFLLSLPDPHEYEGLDISRASAEKGKHLFTYRGCRACHTITHDSGEKIRRIPALNDAGIKLRPEWVQLELLSPRAYNPDARIPLLDVSYTETLDIIAFLNKLIKGVEQTATVPLSFSQNNIEKGRVHIKEYGCYACHPVKGFEEEPPPGRNLTKLSKNQSVKQILTSLNIPTGVKIKKMPAFRFSGEEIEALANYIVNRQTEFFVLNTARENKFQKAIKEGKHIMIDYGCGNCHMLEPDTPPPVSKMLDHRYNVPPTLVGEGAKVQSPWLTDYLAKPFPMRIWMSIRMPFFYLNEIETEKISNLFLSLAGSDPSIKKAYQLPFAPDQIDNEEQAMGRYRFQRDRCMQCHPMNLNDGIPEDLEKDDIAIDLILTKTRLRYEWVRNFLKNPDQFAGPDTRMPFIYFTPEGKPKVSDASKWLDRVARFLYFIDNIPPEDLIAKPQAHEIIDWQWMNE